MTGGPSRPDAAVTQTDLIAGRHDTRFLCCTRRSVRGAGGPAHPGAACSQPALRPAEQKPVPPRAAPVLSRQRADPGRQTRISFPAPLQAAASAPFSPSGPCPSPPPRHSCHPTPRSGEGAGSPGSVAWQRSAARLLRTRFPAAAPPPPPPRRGAVGGLFPGVPTGGWRTARAPSCAKGRGARLPRYCGRPARDPPTERSGTAGARAAKGAEKGPPGETDSSPASLRPPPPLPRRCVLCSNGGGNFPALSWGHRPLGLKLAGDAARRGAERSLGSWQDEAAGSAREAVPAPGEPERARKRGEQAAGAGPRGCVTCLPGGRTHFVPGAALAAAGRAAQVLEGGAGFHFYQPAGRGVTLYLWDGE